MTDDEESWIWPDITVAGISERAVIMTMSNRPAPRQRKEVDSIVILCSRMSNCSVSCGSKMSLGNDIIKKLKYVFGLIDPNSFLAPRSPMPDKWYGCVLVLAVSYMIIFFLTCQGIGWFTSRPLPENIPSRQVQSSMQPEKKKKVNMVQVTSACII